MVRIRVKLRIKFFCANADLIQITAITKLDSTRHDMNVQAIHVVIRDIRCRIGNHSKPACRIMAAVLLTTHVIGFFLANSAEIACERKYAARVIHVNVNFRLPFGAGEYE